MCWNNHRILTTAGTIAEAHGVECFETLTGFKWIANGAMERELKGKRFLMGYEEALGYTIGDLVRDKDGVSALVAFALFAARLQRQNTNVLKPRANLSKVRLLRYPAS